MPSEQPSPPFVVESVENVSVNDANEKAPPRDEDAAGSTLHTAAAGATALGAAGGTAAAVFGAAVCGLRAVTVAAIT